MVTQNRSQPPQMTAFGLCLDLRHARSGQLSSATISIAPAGAFGGADAAAFAIVQIDREPIVRAKLDHRAIGADAIAVAAFKAVATNLTRPVFASCAVSTVHYELAAVPNCSAFWPRAISALAGARSGSTGRAARSAASAGGTPKRRSRAAIVTGMSKAVPST